MSGNDFEFSANSFAQMRADARDKHASPSAATGKRAPAARDGGGDQRSEFAPSSSASDSDDSEDLSAISNRLKGKRPRKNVKSSGFVAAKRGGKVDRVLASEGLFSSIQARLAHTTSSRTHSEPVLFLVCRSIQFWPKPPPPSYLVLPGSAYFLHVCECF